MKCPYLSEASKKVCVKMLELKLKGDLTDFDIRHYCTGKPKYSATTLDYRKSKKK